MFWRAWGIPWGCLRGASAGAFWFRAVNPIDLSPEEQIMGALTVKFRLRGSQTGCGFRGAGFWVQGFGSQKWLDNTTRRHPKVREKSPKRENKPRQVCLRAECVG